MNKKKIYQKLISCMFLLGGMFLVSCLLLCILSVFVWKMDGNIRFIGGGLIAIYVITTVSGGFIMGKLFGKHKFFWGFVIGALYFVILAVLGILGAGTQIQGNERIFPGFMICSIAGMLGGMISPGEK